MEFANNTNDDIFTHSSDNSWGFNFENVRRNEFINNLGSAADVKINKQIKFQKTGTTIVGVCYDGGVVLGADTRATGGTIVRHNMRCTLKFLVSHFIGWFLGNG